MDIAVWHRFTPSKQVASQRQNMKRWRGWMQRERRGEWNDEWIKGKTHQRPSRLLPSYKYLTYALPLFRRHGAGSGLVCEGSQISTASRAEQLHHHMKFSFSNACHTVWTSDFFFLNHLQWKKQKNKTQNAKTRAVCVLVDESACVCMWCYKYSNFDLLTLNP